MTDERTVPVADAPAYGVRPPRYRLPDATRIGVVRLQVSSLERSLAWYERVLGLRAIARAADRATLAAQGSDEPLIELLEHPGAHAVPRRGRLGLYHYAILLPDRASLGRFVRHLAALGAPAGMSDHLVSEAIYLTDPDGLGIEVYADRPRSEWRTNGRELAMSTEPMDVEGVLAAGAGERWAGMPAGTRMGHVHLHVGDLRAAADFYHAALGLDRVVWSYPGALFLSAGGYHHHLGVNTWAAGAPPAAEDEAKLLEWRLVLPGAADADAAAASVAAAGYDVAAEGGDRLLTDPWGTQVRLTATD